jgi:hypothetical protein
MYWLKYEFLSLLGIQTVVAHPVASHFIFQSNLKCRIPDVFKQIPSGSSSAAPGCLKMSRMALESSSF